MIVIIIIACILFAIGISLLIHHGYKHSYYDPPQSKCREESCEAVCFFQPSDISNHETWILICFTNATTMLLVHFLSAS